MTVANDNNGVVIDLQEYLLQDHIQKYQIEILGNGMVGLEGDFTLTDLKQIVYMLQHSNIDLL